MPLVPLLVALAAAQLDPSPSTKAFQYSRYEEATIEGALDALGLARALEPEGRSVEAVDLVRLEVIEPRDPAPRFLNVFHVVTRASVVERELLLAPGEPWHQPLADETRRNLAALPQLSLVLVAAAEGREPGRVRLVVVTKDVWSLRLNWDLSLGSSGGLEFLSVNPAETNLFGTHQTIGLLFTRLPRSTSAGVQYVVPRIGASRVAASAQGGLVLANGGGREGSFASGALFSPLRSARDPWAWSVGTSFLDEVSRLYRGGTVALFTLDPGGACPTAASCVPWEYRTRAASATASVTRSTGWATKRDFSLGFDARQSRYTLGDVAGLDPAAVEAFATTRLPLGEVRVGPFIEARSYRSDFLRVLDVETLALQEDYRLGPAASLRVYPLLRALGSSRDLLGFDAGIAHTAALGDGLARASLGATTEFAGGGALPDGQLRGSLRFVSPRTLAGRLVIDALLLDRFENHLRRSSALGGDSRLRGYPTAQFVGAKAIAANVEWRTRPWQLLDSLQLGGVVFHDAGDAFDRWSALHVWRSAGVGARVLFPQLDRVVLRADLGFPLSSALPAGVSRAGLQVSFGQAFSP